jgi:hypothetical protein
MRSLRKWLALTVPAALAAMVMGCAAPAAPARHVNGAAAAAPQVNGVFHIHRGFVKYCEDIELGDSGLYISGNGVNEPVTLQSTGNCFSLYNSFPYTIVSPLTGKEVTTTVYQYQNGDGHCLWQNDTSFELELGVACNASDTSEDFFGIPGSNADYGGWLGPALCRAWRACDQARLPAAQAGSLVPIEPTTAVAELRLFPLRRVQTVQSSQRRPLTRLNSDVSAVTTVRPRRSA